MALGSANTTSHNETISSPRRATGSRMVKKIMALGLAGAMVIGMATTAFAAVGNDTSSEETGVQSGNGNSVVINTAVVVTNNETTAAEGKTINYPAMTFVYEAKPATVEAGTTVTDNTNETPEHPEGPAVTVEVQSGPANGLAVSGGTITAGTVVLNKKGQEVVLVPTTFTGDITKFDAAGIYRYEITDKSTTGDNANALTTAGIVKGSDKDQSFIIDVYVKNGTSGPEFGGFVLTKDPVKTITPGNAGTAKASGFDDVEIITDGGTAKLDPEKTADLTKNYSYTTYNVTLNKAVKGGLGDKKHGFPFAVAVGVQASHPILNYGYDVTGGTVDSLKHTYNALENIPSDFKLADGCTLKIWGLSPFATINYTETNDTDSKYLVKVGNAAEGNQFQVEVAKQKTETLAAWAEAKNVADSYTINTTATLNEDADAVYYTNTLNEISPTGVALRFAPYIMMLGAAFFLVAFSRRRRVED